MDTERALQIVYWIVLAVVSGGASAAALWFDRRRRMRNRARADRLLSGERAVRYGAEEDVLYFEHEGRAIQFEPYVNATEFWKMTSTGVEVRSRFIVSFIDHRPSGFSRFDVGTPELFGFAEDPSVVTAALGERGLELVRALSTRGGINIQRFEDGRLEATLTLISEEHAVTAVGDFWRLAAHLGGHTIVRTPTHVELRAAISGRSGAPTPIRI